MANGKQTREQMGVKEGDQIVIKGKVSFSRLDKAVEGEALAKENERRSRLGMLHTKAFRSVSIEDPEVVQGGNTPLANFHGQDVYKAKGTGKPTMSLESKSLFAPSYGHIQEDGTVLEMADPQKNPAQGQIVYLMITAFKAKGFNNLGSTFDTVVFEKGPINFYEGKGNSLAGFGKAMNMPVESMPAVSYQEQPVNAPQGELVGAGVGAGQNQGGFGGFSQAPTGDPNQGQGNQGFGGFNPNQGDGGFGQQNQGGFAQQNQGGFGQQNQGGFGQADAGQNGVSENPFGVQGDQVSNQSSPFANNGQRGASPYA